jgi:regulator of protease activity HflC (stomatin/prohibitin superfamily)
LNLGESYKKFLVKFREFELWLKLKYRRHKFKIIINSLILLIFIVYFWNSIFISIPSGFSGVLWHRFTGTVTDKTYKEGLVVILPIDKMYLYDLRIHNVNDSMSVLTSEGLYVSVKYSFRYRPLADSISLIHKTIGPNYELKVIKPEVQGATLSILGNYAPEKLYKMSTLFIQSTIKHLLTKELYKFNIQVEDFVIRDIKLPETIKASIERKLAAEQFAKELDYRLLTEEKEKRRKVIEAEGIREFERISGIQILKWKGLEVTSMFANSKNSKIIIMGNGKNQLPLLLNSDENK